MRNVVVAAYLVCCVLMLILHSAEGLFGFGDKKKREAEEREKAAKEQNTVGLGLASLAQALNDPEVMRETMAMMEDPETMEEIRKLMQDPSFIEDMEKLKHDPTFSEVLKSAKQELQKDPRITKAALRDAAESMSAPKMSDAELGLEGLRKAATDPELLRETLEMLKDPDVAAEVAAMMADPAFQAEMKKMTDSPKYKEALNEAKEAMADLAKDPANLEKMKARAKF